VANVPTVPTSVGSSLAAPSQPPAAGIPPSPLAVRRDASEYPASPERRARAERTERELPVRETQLLQLQQNHEQEHSSKRRSNAEKGTGAEAVLASPSCDSGKAPKLEASPRPANEDTIKIEGTIRKPIHHAACRIQRAWRVSRWRNKFVKFSEREIGWVGTLDWLQHHNLLYGTELADPEDVRWWMQHRSDAPMDREVDPWGCSKLRDHLNKMWYGRTTEELQAEMMKQASEHNLQPQDVHGVHSKSDEAYATYSLPQEAYVLYDKPSRRQWCLDTTTGQPVSVDIAALQGAQATTLAGATVSAHSAAHHSRSLQGMPVASVTDVLRSPPTTERAIGTRPVSVPGIKATSLSPRREASSRARNLLAAGAPPPSAAGAQPYQSPLQTHRTTRAAAPVSLRTGGVSVSGAGGVSAPSSTSAAPVRPLSPGPSQSSRSAVPPARLSLPGALQLRPSSAPSGPAAATAAARPGAPSNAAAGHGFAGAPSWR